MNDFENVFGPLEHHFFPDGGGSGASRSTKATTTSSTAPTTRKRKRGRPTSVKEARESLHQLQELVSTTSTESTESTDSSNGGFSDGFTSDQISSIANVAFASLPSSSPSPSANNSNNNSNSTSSIQSPLNDGSSETFRTLLRCMVFKTTTNDNQQVIDPNVVIRLLSILNAIDEKGKCDVLRFCTLVVLWFRENNNQQQHKHAGASSIGGGSSSGNKKNGDEKITSIFDRYYSCVFAHAIRRETTCSVVDAIRLLITITKPHHVAQYRTQRIRNRINDNRNNKKKDTQQQKQALSALLQLYVDYQQQHRCRDPSASLTMTPTNSNSNTKWFSFPDEDWYRSFFHLRPLSSSEQQQERQSKGRLIQQQGRSLSRLLSASTLSYSYYPHNHRQEEEGSTKSSSSSTSLLLHLLRGSNNNDTNAVAHRFALLDNDDNERIRLGHNLKHLLYEAWNNNNINNDAIIDADNGNGDDATGDDDVDEGWASSSWTKRLRIVSALAELAVLLEVVVDDEENKDGRRQRQCRRLLPKVIESFVYDKVVPVWDGSIEWSRPLAVLLSRCSSLRQPLPSQSLSSPPFGLEGTDLNRLFFQRLQQLFPYLNGQVQHNFSSDLLGALFHNWGCHITTATDGGGGGGGSSRGRSSLKLLRELIEWTDRLFLHAFLSNRNSCSNNYNYVCAAVLDFYSSVCDTAIIINDKSNHNRSWYFLPAPPSPQLFYRLLLSSSVPIVDRLCQLLLKYYNKLYYHHEKEEEDCATSRMMDVDDDEDNKVESTGSMEEDQQLKHIKLLNGYIRDLCLLLWGRCGCIINNNSLTALQVPPPPAAASSKATSSDDDSDGDDDTLFLGSFLRHETRVQLDRDLESILSKALRITRGSAFIGFVLDFIKERKEDLMVTTSPKTKTTGNDDNHNNDKDNDPVNLMMMIDLIDSDNKIKSMYLDYLRDKKGTAGLHAFSSTFVFRNSRQSESSLSN